MGAVVTVVLSSIVVVVVGGSVVVLVDVVVDDGVVVVAAGTVVVVVTAASLLQAAANRAKAPMRMSMRAIGRRAYPSIEDSGHCYRKVLVCSGTRWSRDLIVLSTAGSENGITIASPSSHSST